MLPMRNVIYTKCYLHQMLPMQRVTYRQSVLYEMLLYKNVRYETLLIFAAFAILLVLSTRQARK